MAVPCLGRSKLRVSAASGPPRYGSGGLSMNDWLESSASAGLGRDYPQRANCAPRATDFLPVALRCNMLANRTAWTGGGWVSIIPGGVFLSTAAWVWQGGFLHEIPRIGPLGISGRVPLPTCALNCFRRHCSIVPTQLESCDCCRRQALTSRGQIGHCWSVSMLLQVLWWWWLLLHLPCGRVFV